MPDDSTDRNGDPQGYVTALPGAFRNMGIPDSEVEPIEGEHLLRRVSKSVWMAAQRRNRDHDHAAAFELARAARECFDHGYGDAVEAMTLLAESFHVLRGVPGVSPWDAPTLGDWLRLGGPGQTSASVHAALFVLNVWNPKRVPIGKPCEDDPWGPFDLHAAFGCWDILNRGAFNGWASEPWWP